MAINNTEKDFAYMEFPMAFSRQDGFPLDKTSVYGSLEEAQTYAQTSPLAYVGQVLSVVVDGVSTTYQIKNTEGELEPLGTGDLEGDVGAVIDGKVATDGEVAEMISEIFGSAEPEV